MYICLLHISLYFLWFSHHSILLLLFLLHFPCKLIINICLKFRHFYLIFIDRRLFNNGMMMPMKLIETSFNLTGLDPLRSLLLSIGKLSHYFIIINFIQIPVRLAIWINFLVSNYKARIFVIFIVILLLLNFWDDWAHQIA